MLGAEGPPFPEVLGVSRRNCTLPALLHAGMGQSIPWPVPGIPGQVGTELATSSPMMGAGGIGGYMTAFYRWKSYFSKHGLT